MSEFTQVVSSMRQVFLLGKTMDIKWRRKQLTGILKLIDDNKDRLCQALYDDLHKPRHESCLMEINLVRDDLSRCLNNLKDWMKPEKVNAGILFFFDDKYIKREPYGVVLIIGAWNFPLQLVLLPLIGAIAAGNCAVVKPSELSTSTMHLLEELFPKYLDTECVKCITGGVLETTALLAERWDYILFTGSTSVGKIVAQAAAKHLTPVTLELGGKCPAYIDKGCNLNIVAERLAWGKFVNAGQNCSAPDYVMCCSKDIQETLVAILKQVITKFYGENPKESADFGRIISDSHMKRLKGLLSGSANVFIGGESDEEERYIAPTVLVDVQFTDPVMQEEIFGPILPILIVKDEDEAIQHIAQREKPLALYLFSNNKGVIQKFLTSTSSGSVCINDTIMHVTVPSLPFGGVGHSGMGSYHGKFSFETFSHKKAVLHRGYKFESLNDARYPPYSEGKLRKTEFFMKQSPKKKNCS